MLVSLTVGKVDAGVAVLLTQDKRLIEFPSILLPPNISSGSIVDITVARNTTSEQKAHTLFSGLQDSIFQSFGEAEPQAPILRCRNATQTSVVLEWDPIDPATADVISLSLFRNGQKAGNIPRPTVMQSTKISGLAVDTEYTFHLVLRTSAGTFGSDKVTVKTHKMTDLSGITITPGILPAQLRDSLATAVERIGAKMADTVRIDTTHFVTTEGRGIAWEKAVEMNIPVVRPEWVEGCERGGRIVGVRQYYLDADPRHRQIGQLPQETAPTPTKSPERRDAPLPEPPANGGSQGDASQSSEESEKKEEESDAEEESVPEQKVRIEDRDQHKVALRPAAAAPEAATVKQEEDEEEEEEDDDHEKKAQKPEGKDEPKPSSRSASFQDVAL